MTSETADFAVSSWTTRYEVGALKKGHFQFSPSGLLVSVTAACELDKSSISPVRRTAAQHSSEEGPVFSKNLSLLTNQN